MSSLLLWRTMLWTTTAIRKTVADHHHVFLYFHSSQQICRRRLSSTTSSSPFTKGRYPSFEHMVERYKQAAALSFVLEDRSKGAFVWHRPTAEISSRLLGEKFEEGPCSVFRWRVGSRDGRQKRFLLIQFASISRLKAAIQALDERHSLPLYDRIGFLRDRHIDEWKASSHSQPLPRVQVEQSKAETLYSIVFDDTSPPITFEDFNPLVGTRSGTCASLPSSPLRRLSASQVEESKRIAISLSKLLHGEELLSELQYKLRFFILHQVELVVRRCSLELAASALTSKFPPTKQKRDKFLTNQFDNEHLMTEFEIVPFGSEVSGFGTADSDVDLCFVYRRDHQKKVTYHRGVRLLHTVSIMLERSRKLRGVLNPTERKLRKQNKLPMTFSIHNHYTSVQRIFRAFIPIIKVRSHLLPELNIDISVDTEKNSGVRMAAYLYDCCSKEDGSRVVRPFVLLLKSWAKHHRIVQETPGDWFSSFQITMLAVAFLQSRQILPTIEAWQRRRTSRSTTILDAPTTRSSSEDVGQLLKHFFTFMVNYDFWRHAFDLTTGRCDVAKPHADRDACCILNPFLSGFNITKTVSEAELERFLSKCQQSLEILSQSGPTAGHLGPPLEELFGELSDRLQSLGSGGGVY